MNKLLTKSKPKHIFNQNSTQTHLENISDDSPNDFRLKNHRSDHNLFNESKF